MDKRVGFIGAGQMAEALARGFINKGVVRADQVGAASEPTGGSCLPGSRQFAGKLPAPRATRSHPPSCRARSRHALPLTAPTRQSLARAPDTLQRQVFATDVVPERKAVFRSFGTSALDGNVEVRAGWGI